MAGTGRSPNESTQSWLERIIGLGAPDAQINSVREILAHEGGWVNTFSNLFGRLLSSKELGTKRSRQQSGFETLVGRGQDMPRKMFTDCSKDIVAKICVPFLDDVLTDIEKLSVALQSNLLARIPVCSSLAEQVGSCLAEESVFSRNYDGIDSLTIVKRVSAFEDRVIELRPGMSEENVLACCTNITGLFWNQLGALVDPPLRFNVCYNQSDRANVTAKACRPDETVYLSDFLVAEGEHKAVTMRDATGELLSKLNPLNIFNYGTVIRFLPAYAAAGDRIMFCVIDLHTKALCVQQEFDLHQTGGRLRAIVTAINYFRLLRTMAPHAAKLTTAIPVFKTNGDITYLVDRVRKTWRESFTAPTALYSILCTGEVPFAAIVEKHADCLFVTPLGSPISNEGQGISLSELKLAVRCVLRCLDYLHGKGFVHRDIRWSNIIRDYTAVRGAGSCSFVVIDFEYAALDGDLMLLPNYIFKQFVPFGQPYTSRHDLFFVGHLIETWTRYSSNSSSSSDYETIATKAFVDYLQNVELPPSAADALTHLWIVEIE